jgi:hypothetical protein
MLCLSSFYLLFVSTAYDAPPTKLTFSYLGWLSLLQLDFLSSYPWLIVVVVVVIGIGMYV